MDIFLFLFKVSIRFADRSKSWPNWQAQNQFVMDKLQQTTSYFDSRRSFRPFGPI